LNKTIINLIFNHKGWFRAALLLPPSNRSKRLSEVNTLILEQLSITKFPLVKNSGKLSKSTEVLDKLQNDLSKRIVTNQLINFCDQISTLSFSDYGEEALIVHVNSMNTTIDLLTILSKSLQSNSPSSSSGDDSILSTTIMDAVSSTCSYSIRRAIEYTVSNRLLYHTLYFKNFNNFFFNIYEIYFGKKKMMIIIIIIIIIIIVRVG
jgi:hypothetical protein